MSIKKTLKATTQTVAVCGTLFTTQVSALGDPALTNENDLVVREGETLTLKAGTHVFDDLVIADDGILRVPASTTIVTNRLDSNGGKVEYISGGSKGSTSTITISAFDASKVRDLEIVGNGEKGADASQTPAQAGKDGDRAYSRLTWKGWRGRQATPGENGHNGVEGSDGENAVHSTLYLVGVEPGALVRFTAVGGDGGRGQPGGRGGHGGDRSSLHGSRPGGTGGKGGRGGGAGDSGRLTVYLVADALDGDANPDWMKVAANVAPGRPGDGGTEGAKGKRGSTGLKGDSGAEGDGPRDNRMEDFVQVLVMERATFAQLALMQRVLADANPTTH